MNNQTIFVNTILGVHVDHPHAVFHDYLDVCIAALSMGKKEDDYQRILKKYGKNVMEDFAKLFHIMVVELEKRNEILGEVYMELASKSKSQALGQFFTPTPICDLMAQITNPQPGESFCDPACGSGRTLLAITRNWTDLQKIRSRFYATDIDLICIKMCVINCFLNGMFGLYVHGNSLSLEAYAGYEVLLGKDGVPELRILNEEQLKFVFGHINYAKENKQKMVNQDVQLSLFAS